MESFFLTRGPDRVKVTILDDGRVKLETDAVSQANHTSAEKAIALLEQELGGKTKVEKKNPAVHTHSHDGVHHHH